MCHGCGRTVLLMPLRRARTPAPQYPGSANNESGGDCENATRTATSNTHGDLLNGMDAHRNIRLPSGDQWGTTHSNLTLIGGEMSPARCRFVVTLYSSGACAQEPEPPVTPERPNRNPPIRVSPSSPRQPYRRGGTLGGAHSICLHIYASGHVIPLLLPHSGALGLTCRTPAISVTARPSLF